MDAKAMQDLKKRPTKRNPQKTSRKITPVTIRKSDGRRIMVMPEQIPTRMKRQNKIATANSVSSKSSITSVALRNLPAALIRGAI